MNFSGVAQSALSGLKTLGKTAASTALSGANAAERALGNLTSSVTGRPGLNGSFTASLADKLAAPSSTLARPELLMQPQGFFKQLLAPAASGNSLVPTAQAAPRPSSQTPQASSNTISPAALNLALNSQQPDQARTGRAFVPTAPAAASSGMATSPMTAVAPSTIAGSGSAFTPTPGPSQMPSGSSFGAAVPMDAVLRPSPLNPTAIHPRGTSKPLNRCSSGRARASAAETQRSSKASKVNHENAGYAGRLIARVFENFPYKVVAAGLVVILRFLFDSVNQSAMLALFVLMVFDTITGIFAAYKTGQRIESHKILRLAIKTAVYFTLISAGFVSEKAIPVAFLDETIIGTLAFTELLSILENTARSGFTIAAVIIQKLQKQVEP